MCIKMMYNKTIFKNVFQYQTAKFNNAKPHCFPFYIKLKIFLSFFKIDLFILIGG